MVGVLRYWLECVLVGWVMGWLVLDVGLVGLGCDGQPSFWVKLLVGPFPTRIP